MKKIIIVFAILASTFAFSQVGIGTNTPSTKSILDLTATDKGLLLPRMTTAQRIAIAPSAITDKSMQVFDTDTNTIWFWNGTVWVENGGKNIYSTNGALSGDRVVTQGAFKLNFISTNPSGGVSITGAPGNPAGGGFLGIGTTSPAGRLHLENPNGDDEGNDFLFDDYGNQVPTMFFRHANGTKSAPADLAVGSVIGRIVFSPRYNGNLSYTNGSWIQSSKRTNTTTTDSDLEFVTSNITRMKIAETGNVGINTSSPLSTLDVAGSLGLNYTTTSTNFTLGNNNYSLMVNGAGGVTITLPAASSCTNRIYSILNAASTNVFYSSTITDPVTGGVRNFVVAQTLDMIQSDGTNWIIINPGVNNNLYNSNGTLTSNRTVAQGANTLAFTSSVTNGFSVDGTTFSVDASNDRVGIGVNAPTQKLDVNGNARIRSLIDGNGSTATYSRYVVADASGNLAYGNRPVPALINYTSLINDAPVTTTYAVADFYPIMAGINYSAYSSSGGFGFTWDSSGTFWTYDLVANSNDAQSCTIQIIWMPK